MQITEMGGFITTVDISPARGMCTGIRITAAARRVPAPGRRRSERSGATPDALAARPSRVTPGRSATGPAGSAGPCADRAAGRPGVDTPGCGGRARAVGIDCDATVTTAIPRATAGPVRHGAGRGGPVWRTSRVSAPDATPFTGCECAFHPCSSPGAGRRCCAPIPGIAPCGRSPFVHHPDAAPRCAQCAHNAHCNAHSSVQCSAHGDAHARVVDRRRTGGRPRGVGRRSPIGAFRVRRSHLSDRCEAGPRSPVPVAHRALLPVAGLGSSTSPAPTCTGSSVQLAGRQGPGSPVPVAHRALLPVARGRIASARDRGGEKVCATPSITFAGRCTVITCRIRM